MTDFRKILSLVVRQRSYRQIATAVGCSHQTVARVKAEAARRGVFTIADVDKLSDEDVASWFVDGRRSVCEEFVTPDFAAICRARSFVSKPSLKSLWLTYCSQPVAESKRLYGVDRFRELVNKYVLASGTQPDGSGHLGLGPSLLCRPWHLCALPPRQRRMPWAKMEGRGG